MYVLLMFMTCWTETMHAQSFSNTHLSSSLDELFQTRYPSDGPGAVVVISKGGEVVYSQQFGMADLEAGRPVSAKTRFAIGSITKQFTAAAILLLAEQGYLKLTDPVKDYLPALSGAQGEITIEQVLTHTSGLPDYPHIPSIRQRLRDDLEPKEILDAVLAEPLEFIPGKQVSYSNTGYFLLGQLIEAVSGQTYAAFLQEQIFEPLQMNETLVGDHRDVVPNRAQGYSSDAEDVIVNATYHSSSYAAGGIISTGHDLHRWMAGLWARDLLGQESLGLMFSNYTLANGIATGGGLGWERNEIGGLLTYEHSGFEPGYKCNSVYVPEERLYVVVLQNSEIGSPTPSMINAAAQVLENPYPDESQTVDLTEEASQQLVGTYQFEQGDTRIVGTTDSGYYYRAPGGQATPLYPVNERTLVFPEGYRQLTLVKDESGAVQGLQYKNRAFTREARKVSSEVGNENVEVTLAPEVLRQYVGSYQLEAFIMHISLEAGKLFAQPDGSDKLQLVPKGEASFFVRELGAEVSFRFTDDAVAIDILIEGERMTGKRT